MLKISKTLALWALSLFLVAVNSKANSQIRRLDVTSVNPNSGVFIQVTPTDQNGNWDGTTPFTRYYPNNNPTRLLAPSIAGGNTFVKWLQDGRDYVFTESVTFPMDADHTMTAVYATPSAPHILLSPTTLSPFSATQGGASPSSQTFTITNVGGGTLSWSVSDNNTSWLDENPASGTGNSQTIGVSITTTNMPPGTYNATIYVNSSNADNSPQTVAVTYVVSLSCPTLSVQPEYQFNYQGIVYDDAVTGATECLDPVTKRIRECHPTQNCGLCSPGLLCDRWPNGQATDIKRWGCALMCAVMVLKYLQVTPINGLPVTPQNLNDWLIANKGYLCGGYLDWSVLYRYSNKRIKYEPFQDAPQSVTQPIIDALLRNNIPVVLKVNYPNLGPHFVVAKGMSNCNRYEINDPAFTNGTLSRYGNTWLGIRKLVPVSQGTQVLLANGTLSSDTSFSIITYSDVELLLTDSLGRRVGFDPVGDSVIAEIPNSDYTIESLQPDSTEGDSGPFLDSMPTPPVKVLSVGLPEGSGYKLSVIAADSGHYSVEFKLYPALDTPIVLDVAGRVDSGSVTEVRVRNKDDLCFSSLGDLNKDGSISPADVVLELNCVFLGSGDCGLCFADVNCDALLSPADVVLVLNKTFLGSLFPCP